VPDAPAATTFAIDLPVDQTLTRVGRRVLALSPDGMQLVFVANQQLYIRSFRELSVKPLDGTSKTDPSQPVFSPDGQWIAFWSNGQVKKIPVNGGTAVSLAEIGNPMGISWIGDHLVLGQADPPAIVEVPVNGSPMKTLIAADLGKAESVQSPQLIAGGRAVLFTLRTGDGPWSDAAIVVQDLASSKRTVLVQGGTDGRVVPSGHLLYSRDDTLFAMPFDEERRVVSGSAVPVQQDILPSVGGFTGATQLAISNTGTLAFVPGGRSGGEHVLAWLDRQGKVQPTNLPPKRYWPGGPGLAVSPDGKRVAARIMGSTEIESDIWIWEVGRDALVRLTSTGTASDPVWTPDGRRVCTESSNTLVCQPYDGSGPPQALFKNALFSAISAISPDGSSWLLSMNAKAGFDIWIAPNTPPFDARPLIRAADVNQASASISPDGRWLAYVSNESGGEQIYVRPFPAIGDGRWQVSNDGGVAPRWSRDGRELYFLSAFSGGASLSSTLMAVPILKGDGFVAGPPVAVAPFPNRVRASYDVTPDGRFLISVPAVSEITDGGVRQRIVIVQNWFEELKAKVSR
jgi:serine/threonine-protein kinase